MPVAFALLSSARVPEIVKERHIRLVAMSPLGADRKKHLTPRQIELASTILAQKGWVWNRREREGEAMHFGALAMNPRSEVHTVTERSPDSSRAKRLCSGAATNPP